MVKSLPANAGDTRDAGLIPGLRRSPEVENGNLFQYSFLKNSMGRGIWWATVHSVGENQDMAEDVHACILYIELEGVGQASF